MHDLPWTATILIMIASVPYCLFFLARLYIDTRTVDPTMGHESSISGSLPLIPSVGLANCGSGSIIRPLSENSKVYCWFSFSAFQFFSFSFPFQLAKSVFVRLYRSQHEWTGGRLL